MFKHKQELGPGGEVRSVQTLDIPAANQPPTPGEAAEGLYLATQSPLHVVLARRFLIALMRRRKAGER